MCTRAGPLEFQLFIPEGGWQNWPVLARAAQQNKLHSQRQAPRAEGDHIQPNVGELWSCWPCAGGEASESMRSATMGWPPRRHLQHCAHFRDVVTLTTLPCEGLGLWTTLWNKKLDFLCGVEGAADAVAAPNCPSRLGRAHDVVGVALCLGGAWARHPSQDKCRQKGSGQKLLCQAKICFPRPSWSLHPK